MKLQINNIDKTYPNGVKALNKLSITIGKGMFGLLGPNGAGKSSLMRTIATLQDPDSGSIQFNDSDIFADKLSLRKTLGYLPQEFGVYNRISALRLLDYLALLKGITNKKERNSIIEHCLEVTNLTEVKNKSVSGYSGGMKQRFGIAQLLLNDPSLIIVDEPTAGLDPSERQRFLNILREIASNKIVIFSTHIVEDIRELCSDMAIMNQGSILAHCTPQEAILELKGKIYSCDIQSNELEEYKRKFTVLSSGYNRDNSLNIRIFSEEILSPNFTPANVVLEDKYFLTLPQN